MPNPDDNPKPKLDFMQNPDVIIINLEDLPLEPDAIIISENDLVAAPSLQVVSSANIEDLGTIEVPDIPCAIDHTMIEPGQAFGRCKFCNTPYHKECWDYNGGCAVLGCPGVKNPKSFQLATSL